MESLNLAELVVERAIVPRHSPPLVTQVDVAGSECRLVVLPLESCVVRTGDLTTQGSLAALTEEIQVAEAFYLTWRQECRAADVLARRSKPGGKKSASGPAPSEFPFSTDQTGSQGAPNTLKLVSSVAKHGVAGHDLDLPKDGSPKKAE